MAHYAYVNEQGIVTSVIAGPNEETAPEGFGSWEEYFTAKGNGTAVRTSRNTIGGVHYNPETGLPSEDQSKAFRKNYGAKGFTYDRERDGFIPPQPLGSILDEETFLWILIPPHPQDGKEYIWDTETEAWFEVVE